LLKEVYDTIAEIDDVKVPFCRNAASENNGKEMSHEGATCAAWEAPAKTSRLEELDRLIKMSELRGRTNEEEENDPEFRHRRRFDRINEDGSVTYVREIPVEVREFDFSEPIEEV
jgi:hypothetical protein